MGTNTSLNTPLLTTSEPGLKRLSVAAWIAVSALNVVWLDQFDVFWPTVRRTGEHWFLTALFGTLFLIIAGAIGRGVGLPDLFRTNPSRPGWFRWLRPLSAGFGAATFVIACLATVYFADLLNYPTTQPVPVPRWAHLPPWRLPMFVMIGGTPIMFLLLLAVAFPLSRRRQGALTRSLSTSSR